MKKLDKSFKLNPLYEADGYKPSHKRMLAENTTRLYGTWIPRSLKYMHPSITKIMSAGEQLVIRYIHSHFKEFFFDQPITVAQKFTRDMTNYLNLPYDGTHFEDLHRLGYLPFKVKALPEGIYTNPNVPHATFINTVDGYAWLTLYLETMFSKLAWQLPTVATIGAKFKQNAVEWVTKTDPNNLWLTEYMCHDFHSRGGNPFTSIAAGIGHALSNIGSDTLNVIEGARYYYDVPEEEVCINSVNASEHSVSTTKIFTVGEKQMIIDWLKEFPAGILSIVADTFDLWKLITEYLSDPEVKELIMARDGKLVVRPDCYSEDTLFFTNYGWKNISDIKNGALVAQIEEDGSYTFVKPSKIVDQFYEGEMYKYTDFHGKMDLIVTPNHRMVYKQFDKWKVEQAEDLKPNNYTKSFLRSAKAKNKNRKLSFIERLNIAFQADGSYQTGVNSAIRFSFSKIRKIQRLESLLKEHNVEYKIYDLSDGRCEFNIKIESALVSKDFNWVDTSDLCSNWSKEFIEELSHWDSCIRNDGRIKFDNTNKDVVNVVDLIALSAGYGCLISVYEDVRKDIFSKVYTANILLDNRLGGQSIKCEKIQYKGNVVCVTVPTGKVMVKRNRCTMVCGNSGDPVDIICGINSSPILDGKVKTHTDLSELGIEGTGKRRFGSAQITDDEFKGVIELLWEIFGGTINDQGYKVLDPRIGAIYGDSINLERQIQIYERLAAKGFAASNIVVGVGSFSYQYMTRDQAGFAAKGAWFENNGKGIDIYKDPVTDDGTKKSLKGLLQVVYNQDGELEVIQQCTPEQEAIGELKTIYEDGKFYNQTTLSEIRERLAKTQLAK